LALDNGEDKNVLLTDIKDWEDFYGDMDFKVAGDHQGMTAIQVDTKTAGLTRDVIVVRWRRQRKPGSRYLMS